jgi:hypothetical protein
MGISASASVTSSARPTLDHAGVTASLVCAAHCVLVALFLGVMPAAATLAAPWIEWAFLGVSTAIGIFALVPGYRRHRQPMPLVLFGVGLVLLVSARTLHLPPSPVELLVVGLAAGAMIMAHWKNRGAVHACACGPRHH